MSGQRSTSRGPSPAHCSRRSRVPGVSTAANPASRVGRRAPLRRDRPVWPGGRGRGGSSSAASRRRRVSKRARDKFVTWWRHSSTAERLSATQTTARVGHQRTTRRRICTPGDVYGHQPPRQEPTGHQGRPDGPIQEAMIGLQVGRCAVCHHPQSGGDGPPPWGKDGAGEEDVDVRPNGLRTNRREDRHDTEARGRPREQSILSCLRNAVLSLPHDFGTHHHNGQSRAQVLDICRSCKR